MGKFSEQNRRTPSVFTIRNLALALGFCALVVTGSSIPCSTAECPYSTMVNGVRIGAQEEHHCRLCDDVSCDACALVRRNQNLTYSNARICDGCWNPIKDEWDALLAWGME